MMAAISAARDKNEVYILEKNNRLGKKLLITGKGRCNITNGIDIGDFIANIPGNGRFLYSAFQNFTNQDIIELMKENGVAVKEERGNRVFPVSDRSMDVLCAFEKELKKLKVNIILNCKVVKIESSEKKVNRVRYIKDGNENNLNADKIIIATGGASYPLTGSTGDGYKFARELGHTVTDIRPSLVPLTAKGESLNLCKAMQGLSLRNVKVTFVDTESNKKIYDDFGEMLFTHFGVSGPTILSASAHLIRYKNTSIELHIDLKPALSMEKLDLRLQRDFEKNKNKEIKNSLNDLLPQKMIEPIIKLSGIKENKKVNEVTKEERRKLAEILKCFKIEISGFRPIEEGIVTSGGVSVKEINPKTMESKIIHGLYFAGEVIDVDAYTGGFNLQIAYSTGVTAGRTAVKK